MNQLTKMLIFKLFENSQKGCSKYSYRPHAAHMFENHAVHVNRKTEAYQIPWKLGKCTWSQIGHKNLSRTQQNIENIQHIKPL